MIRTANPSDIVALVALEEQAFDPALHHAYANTRQHFKHLLSNGNADILVYEQAGKICGAAEILYRSRSPFARLYSLAVLPDYRKKGIGQHLLEAVDSTAKKKRCLGILCESRKEMVPRYERHGYTILHKLKAYYPHHVDGYKLIKRFDVL